MKFERNKQFIGNGPCTEYDTDGIGYVLTPRVLYVGPTQRKIIRWQASFKGKRLSKAATDKRAAKNLCVQHYRLNQGKNGSCRQSDNAEN